MDIKDRIMRIKKIYNKASKETKIEIGNIIGGYYDNRVPKINETPDKWIKA